MILAFDIGGSRIRAALWDGALTALGEVPTPTGDRQAIVKAVAGFARGRALRGTAISIAGVVDPATGIGTVANIPAINGLALGPVLQEATGRPVLVLNDADCFALAEARHGAGRGHGSVFGVILGSGVGGGLVIGGKVVTGVGGFAGEWGHGPVIRGDHAFRCGCGQVGCIDTIGGARGLERLHKAVAGADLTSAAIVSGWQAGQSEPVATMALWRDLVAGPLAMVLNVVGASVVPVGGGLSRAPGLVGYLDQALRARVLGARVLGAQVLGAQVLGAQGGAVAVPAECGADAGLLGAALAGEMEWR